MSDDPQSYNRKDLQRFYADLVLVHGWQHLTPLLNVLDALLKLREERGLFTFTSHELLTFTSHPEYPAWANDDIVAIEPLRSGKAEVHYVRRREPCSEESVVVGYDTLISTVDAMLSRLSPA